MIQENSSFKKKKKRKENSSFFGRFSTTYPLPPKKEWKTKIKSRELQMLGEFFLK